MGLVEKSPQSRRERAAVAMASQDRDDVLPTPLSHRERELDADSGADESVESSCGALELADESPLAASDDELNANIAMSALASPSCSELSACELESGCESSDRKLERVVRLVCSEESDRERELISAETREAEALSSMKLDASRLVSFGSCSILCCRRIIAKPTKTKMNAKAAIVKAAITIGAFVPEFVVAAAVTLVTWSSSDRMKVP